MRVSLRDRLVAVTEKKFGGSAMAWAKAAGLSPTSLGTFHTRWRAAEASGGALPSLKRPALEALAKAAGVSFEWLATGRGVELDARYPSLEAVIAAHPGRWEPGAVAQARSMRLDADSDPGEAWWMQVLDAADTGLRVALAKLPDRKVDPLEGL